MSISDEMMWRYYELLTDVQVGSDPAPFIDRGVHRALQHRFALPVTHVVVDLDAERVTPSGY